MRYLLLFLALCSAAQADPGYVTYTETVYRLSCERTMLRIFEKYGAGDWTGPHKESFTVNFCSKAVSILEADHWKSIDSPAGTGCMDVVKTFADKRGYPSKDEMFNELCYSITRKDGQ